MRIVFFGTPAFAVPSLRALVGEGFPVAAVVTQPDKPHGRSRSRTVPPPIKTVAIEEDLTVIQPEHPADPSFVDEMRSLRPDIGIVVAYGHLLKPELLTVPRLGMINVHASLLPKLRGAAPIQCAIMRGFHETGVSVMQMDRGMDSGPVFLQVKTPIARDETFGELSVRLSEIGALALIEALTLIGSGNATPTVQNEAAATLAPKVTRETARIDWTETAADVARRIRAMDPSPGAWSEVSGQPIKLFGPRPVSHPGGGAPGTILDSAKGLVVQTGNGAVQLSEVQPAGKKRMPASSWLRGRTGSLAQFR